MHKRILLTATLLAAAVVCPARATLTTSNNTVTYTGNGATTAFSTTFPFQQASDLVVTVAGVTKANGADYSLTGAGFAAGGTVTFSVAPSNGVAVVITRTVDYLQRTSLRGQGQYLPAAVEKSLDKLSMGQQQLQNLYTNPPASVLPANVTAKLNGIRFADQFANIQAAITDAGTTGAVLIPSTYVASDTFSNPNGVPIIDLRAGAMSYRSYATSDDFGAVGDGSTDDAAKLQSAINSLPASGGTLVLRPGKNFRIATQLSITKPYTHVVGYGAKITQNGTLQRGFTSNAAGVVIEGVWLYNANGNSEWADAPAGSTNAIGVYFDTGCDGCKAINNRVEGWGWAGIRVYQSKRVLIQGNEVIGIGLTKPLVAGNNNNLGIELYLSGIGYPGTRIIANSLHDLAQGIYVGYDWQDVVIASNDIRSIQGQHGMYIGSVVNLVVAFNSVDTTGQNCIKVQISSDTTVNAENISIVGNPVNACGGAGIIVLPASGGLTPRFKNVSIVGNPVRNPAATGIDVDHTDGYNIESNSVSGAGTFAIQTRSENGSGRIAGNVLFSSQQTGIYALATSTSYLGIIENNYIVDPGLSGTGTSDVRSGIYMSTGEWIARDNVITIPTASLGFSLNVNAAAIVTLQRNRTPAAKNNILSGTLLIDGRTAIGASGGATLTANAQTTSQYVVTCSVAATAWTHGPPSNPTSDATLTYTVRNTSGGGLGVLTWDVIFKMAAWTQPGAGQSRSITFRYDGTNWVQVSTETPDVPN